jgi:hypothetical protein
MIVLSGQYVIVLNRKTINMSSNTFTLNLKRNLLLVLALLLLIVLFTKSNFAAQPSAPNSLDYLYNSSPSPSVGAVISVNGGVIATINFNTTTQNPRWKGFVGNITGKFVLSDASGLSLYDWSLTYTQGEIYATRKNSLVDWASVGCALESHISTEQNELNFQETDIDSINNTFNGTLHRSFYAGDMRIFANSCPSTQLYVNGERQENSFQEILLYEGKLIYAGLLEDSSLGFNNERYDYQLIVPDNAGADDPTEVYYFYVELI